MPPIPGKHCCVTPTITKTSTGLLYIIGSDIDGSKKQRFCWKGVALGNKITQVIIAYQVMYPIPNQKPQKSEPIWRFFVGADIDFDRLYLLPTPPGMQLYQCLELFSPNLNDF